ncbi:hypothetical protein D3C76_336790 [compost metagenome]
MRTVKYLRMTTVSLAPFWSAQLSGLMNDGLNTYEEAHAECSIYRSENALVCEPG